MDINKALLNLITDNVVTCKQLADFYDMFHEDKDFLYVMGVLSKSIHIDMSQIKEELYASEDAYELVAMEYIQKHYPSAILFMNLIPREKLRFIH